MQRYRKQRNYGCRIHDQLTYFGMRTIVLENEKVRISILLDKGTEIFEYLYKPLDLDFMWLTENGVQNPTDYLPTSPDPLSTFLDYFPGGWQEVFPNGGPTSSNLGAQFGQHGEVAHMPWDYEIIEDNPERISVAFSVRTKRIPCKLTKKLTLETNSSSLCIEEQLDNLSTTQLNFMWGQHIAFGAPFLEVGSTIKLPDGISVLTESVESEVSRPGRVKRGMTHKWPFGKNEQDETVDLSIIPEKGTPSEMLYLHGFEKDAWYKIENHAKKVGMQVMWDSSELPYLWYWQEFGETKEYPWYGRHYNIGLEPFCGYPTHGLEEAINNQSAGVLKPNETKYFKLTTTPYEIK